MPAPTATLDPLDAPLLNAIQAEIPLVERPFRQLADPLETTEERLLERLRALRNPAPPERPLIRQISAIFDSKSLGYETALVAARVEESHLPHAADIINQHPGVSHNYRRNHAFNLWYTLAIPPDSQLGLQKTVDILHRQSGALSTRILPTERLFKIGVKFDLSADAESDLTARTTTAQSSVLSPHHASPLSDADKRLVRLLQQDLPLVPEPFTPWAAEAGMSLPDFLARAQSFLDRHLMRRFAAVLKHRNAGISANAMGVWVVPPHLHDAFGHLASSFSAVSHCYLRTTYPDWPYSIFTMVHAPTREQAEAVLQHISQESGIRDYATLFSTAEYKKTRVQYFTPAIPEWEARNA